MRIQQLVFIGESDEPVVGCYLNPYTRPMRYCIEIVKNAEAMAAYDGVGCLLRYLMPERDHKPAA